MAREQQPRDYGDQRCLTNEFFGTNDTDIGMDQRMAINQRPAFFAIQAVVPGMRRLGGGSARMVLFLASDDAAMCSAQESKVDAGWM